MPRRILEEYVGTRINQLTILSINTELRSNHPVKVFTCLCDCGERFSYQASKVFSNQIQSCGCTERSTRSQTRTDRDHLYIVWFGMKNRCTDPKHDSYHRYGGRGITYCPAWKEFETFYQDMKDGYQKDLDLDRIENDLGYSKANCQWITHRANVQKRAPRGGQSKYIGVSLDKRTFN